MTPSKSEIIWSIEVGVVLFKMLDMEIPKGTEV